MDSPSSRSSSSTSERLRKAAACNQNPSLRQFELFLCAASVEYFIDNWYWTFDPRLVAQGKSAIIPFNMWPKQRGLLWFLDDRLELQEDGLVEKSRDWGFTWLAAAYATHKWLFKPGFETVFGSRKQDLVDKIGDPKTIIEKVRIGLRALPPWMMPKGFSYSRHAGFLKIVNPVNNNTITGEAGDEMGRGGRSSLYFLDEAAFMEHADRIEAATSANSDCRIFGSTVNGPGNLFARKRASLQPRQVFVCDYRDDPRKTPAWVAAKKASMEPHVWASEYERDYGASVEGICIPAAWVASCQRIADLMPIEPYPTGICGLDVGGGGKGKSVAVARLGPWVTVPQSWGDPDTTETAFKGIEYAKSIQITRSDREKPCKITTLNFDEIGIGKGVLSTLQRVRKISSVPINVGNPATDNTWPDGKTAEEKFGNLKAELWWACRERCRNTHLMVLFIESGGAEGEHHVASDLLSLPPNSAGPDAQALAYQLSLPKAGHNEKGKIVIESKIKLSGRGIPSPDHAEALILTFAENGAVELFLKAFGINR